MDLQLGQTFERNGRKWVVTASTDTFVIGTCVSVEGEPGKASDTIKLSKAVNNEPG